jgi:pimeloyl-ACP methyl ester carboxylesterase
MKRQRNLLLTLAITSFLTSCSQVWSPSRFWEAGERLASGRRNDTTVEKLIPVPLDRNNPSLGNFDLYYFVRMPGTGKAQKTVLFCAGGPGQVVWGPVVGVSDTFAEFLTQNGYNVVYFHQRGLGFSQIPASNRYDRFLKTVYAVEDIDAIRKDFLGKDGKWDGIIGWSYGTVVAQQYTYFHPGNVDRLVLIGPESRDKFKSAPNSAFTELADAIRETNRHTLEQVFNEYNDFAMLMPNQRAIILDKAFGTRKKRGIFDNTEASFGSLQFVIDSYEKLKADGQLEKHHLSKYSREFFRSLRSLRMVGWLPLDKDAAGHEAHDADRRHFGTVISCEILSQQGADDCPEPQTKERGDNSSDRVFYVIGAYDGIDARFLEEWLKNDKRDIRDALRKSGGDAGANEYVEKVGISEGEIIRPWDPAEFPHNRPTLILKGGADTVSAGGQAERFYLDALTGDRTLIEFLGVGHLFALPRLPDLDKPILTGAVRVNPPAIQPGETRAVLGTYSGRTLDESFRFKLEGNTLEPSLRFAGLGMLDNAAVRDARAREPNVVAIIENTGDSSVNGNRQKWTITNKLFRGGVYLDPPPIGPGKTSEVHGTIEESWPDHVIHFKKPDGLEEGLEVICVTVTKNPVLASNKFLVFWFRNNSPGRVDMKQREWLVSNGKFSGTVTFEPGPIESNKVMAKSARLPLGFDVDIDTTPPGALEDGLRGCLAPRKWGNEDTYIAIMHTLSTPVNGANLKWQIKNPIARWSMDVDPPEFKQLNDGDKVPARNVKVEEWKERPMLNKPSNLEPGLEFRGHNIESADKLSVLLRNNSQVLVNPVARDWVYIDPNESDKSAACFGPSTALDCLIYSFLVMGPETFNNERDNQIIGILKGFANVCHRNGDRQGPRTNVGDGCP